MRLFTRLLFAAAALMVASDAAQPSIPDTPAGKVFEFWLTAFNSGDRGRIEAYFDNFDPGRRDRTDNLMGFREQTGGFDLIRVEKSEPLHLEALVKEKAGDNFAKFDITLAAADPPKVSQLRLQIVPRPADQPEAPRLTESEAIRALDAKAADATQKDT